MDSTLLSYFGISGAQQGETALAIDHSTPDFLTQKRIEAWEGHLSLHSQ